MATEQALRDRRSSIVVKNTTDELLLVEAGKIDTILAMMSLQHGDLNEALISLISATSLIAKAVGKPLKIERAK